MSSNLVDSRKVWIVGSGPFKVFNTLEHAKEFVRLCGDNRQIVEAELISPNGRKELRWTTSTVAWTGYCGPLYAGRGLDYNDPLVSPSIPPSSN